MLMSYSVVLNEKMKKAFDSMEKCKSFLHACVPWERIDTSSMSPSCDNQHSTATDQILKNCYYVEVGSILLDLSGGCCSSLVPFR